MSYLEIKNMSCGYNDGFHLKSVNLALSKGAFAGIIGRNGSGKSTLFKGIVGDLPLREGKVVLNGLNINTLSLKSRAKLIAIVSQFIELSPISVEDYVLMGRIPYRRAFQFSYTDEDMEIATKYIELTGIAHLRKKMVTELSGGEQQIVAIACALTQQPALLLLDEPTSHLDITFQSKIMNLLQQLNEQEDLTIVMVIHDLNLAAEYCDHLTLMKSSEVLYQGVPNDVLTFHNIEKAYDAVVIVKNNPISGNPVVFPVSERTLNKYNKQKIWSNDIYE